MRLPIRLRVLQSLEPQRRCGPNAGSYDSADRTEHDERLGLRFCSEWHRKTRPHEHHGRAGRWIDDRRVSPGVGRPEFVFENRRQCTVGLSVIGKHIHPTTRRHSHKVGPLRAILGRLQAPSMWSTFAGYDCGARRPLQAYACSEFHLFNGLDDAGAP
jgi:hypothetical protein